MTVAPNEMPGFARLYVLTPYGPNQEEGHGFLGVAFIDAVYRLDLKSASAGNTAETGERAASEFEPDG